MQLAHELSALHRAALRSELEDCTQGFCALELPEACVVVCRLDERFLTRPVLGSSTPARLSRARVLEDEATLARMWSALEAERVRASNLSFIAAALAEEPEPIRAAWPNHAVSRRDVSGILRGQCPSCNACPGFRPTHLDHISAQALKRANLAPRDVQALRKVCAECGCAAALHEKLREKTVPDDEY